MNLAPIVPFAYNRPWHTQQTVEALQKNELAQAKEVRDYIKTIDVINLIYNLSEEIFVIYFIIKDYITVHILEKH